MNEDLEHIVAKSRSALAGCWGVLSTGEKLAAALVLNRPDWLDDAGYTMADAIDRIGPQWTKLIPAAAHAVSREGDREAEKEARAIRERKESTIFRESSRDDPLRLESRLVSHGCAPGYRHVHFYFDTRPHRASEWCRIELKIRPEDAEVIDRALLNVHRLAWSSAHGPLDALPGETVPSWIR